jgi:hypothetical protein
MSKKKIHYGDAGWAFCGFKQEKKNLNKKKVTCKLCQDSILSGPRRLVKTRKRQLAMAEKEVWKILQHWE